jgi:hypothetical protein
MPTVLKEKVADILERETQFTIANWLTRVNAEPEVNNIPLTAEERCAHLPKMFRDLVTRLRNPLPSGTTALTSDGAHEYGGLRRDQGYSPAMMVEESRMLEVSIYETLQSHSGMMDNSDVLIDVMAIADEVDSQLAQAMTSYMSKVDEDGQAIDA